MARTPCPHCGVHVPPPRIGDRGTCPSCGETIEWNAARPGWERPPIPLDEAQEIVGRNLVPGQALSMGTRDFERLMEALVVASGAGSELVFALRARLASSSD